MKKIILFLFVLLLLPLSAQAAISCKASSKAVKEGNACGQLGETRMLSDGSGLVACVVEDASQTGTKKDCTWKDMTSSGGGEGGEMCGHLTLLIPGTPSYSSSNQGPGDGGYSCSYGNLSQVGNIPCHGDAIIDGMYAVVGNSYWLSKKPVTGYIRLFYMKKTFLYNKNFANLLYVKPNCPSGYSLKYWKPNYSLGSGSLIDCNFIDYELTCVKD